MPRLFISHSSRDNVAALAFQRWLVGRGWAAEDIFIDLHSIGAGERWRETLRKANASCEAVLLLASPDSLDSPECQREMNLAEDLGKEIIVALLRDLTPADSRLARYADRQLVDLSAEPTERMDPFEHDGKLHRVHFHMPALLAIAARLAHLGIAPGSFAWEPADGVGPYPGLEAFGEDDAAIFFGREADIMAGLTRLRLLRKRRTPRLLVIVAASGAGKSSFLRAGLWPRLKRDPDFAPLAILRPALGILSGPDGVGRRIAPWFARHGRKKVPGDVTARLMKPGHEAAIALASLIGEATTLATTVRQAGAPDARPPAPILAIDQGEELFAAENLAESERFLELIAAVLKEPPGDADPYVLVTIRADSVEALLQRWPALGLDTPESHYLAPLAPSAYRDVIVKPAQVYSTRVRRLDVEPALVDQLARDAHGADALPLLAFTLERLFQEFSTDGNLTLARYEGMGGIGGSIDRTLAAAQQQAGVGGTADDLRRLMVPGLATWDPVAGAAKRIVATEADLTGSDRASLAPLAAALVKNRLLTRGAGTIEVAHEALLRRPPIASWLEARKDSLKLRDDVLREAKDWADGKRQDRELVRHGVRLEAALALADDDDFAAALAPATDYLTACVRQETAAKRRAQRTRAAIYTLMAGVIVALTAVIYKEPLFAFAHHVTVLRPYMAAEITPHVLSAERERALKPGDPFRECRRDCPEMVVIPPGTFVMGSPDGKTAIIGLDGKPKPGPLAPAEPGRQDDEGPQREVRMPQAFAVGKYEVTFAEWDACVAMGGCPPVSDSGWGKGKDGRRPVINVSWDEATKYAAWLSQMTGQTYRLPTEAEWEYVTRAGTTTTYNSGADEASLCGHANFADRRLKAAAPTLTTADVCDDGQTVPAEVGSYAANRFGLHDTHGNVAEWTASCYRTTYQDAPTDGSLREDSCADNNRVLRGGSWVNVPVNFRSAARGGIARVSRLNSIGFRVGRLLSSPRPPQ